MGADKMKLVLKGVASKGIELVLKGEGQLSGYLLGIDVKREEPEQIGNWYLLSDLKGEIEGLMSNVVSLIRSWTEGLGGGGKASACHN